MSMAMLSLSEPRLDLLALSGALLLCYVYYRRTGNSRPPLPPGPKPLPIVGNMFSMPEKGKPWETYSRWHKEYGDVVHIHYFRTPIIILNTFKAVNDLLEKRSSIYSNRPHLTMFHELMDFEGTAFEPYGNIWRKHRALYHKYLNQTAVKEFYPVQLAAARKLLRFLLEEPHDFVQHIRHMAASVVLGIAYGRDTLPKSDPMVVLTERTVRWFAQALRPGAYLVDTFPILKYVPPWVPGAGFQKIALEGRKDFYDMRDIPFRQVKAELIAGTARPSLSANALTELGIDDESDEDVKVIKSVAGSLFGGGSDTTTSALHWFILAMILYPDVQMKGQAELDRVIGKGRLPDFNDRPDLPYIEAIMKEVLRWKVVTPIGVPHVTAEDDVYEGYYIPAKSIVFANSWNILHDPDMYPEPSVFRPERFLPDKDGNEPRDPTTGGAFGFGRRICAGRHLAESAIWITIVSVLSTFNITRAVDKFGRPMEVNDAFNPETESICHPLGFPCAIIPRTPEAAVVIRSLE